MRVMERIPDIAPFIGATRPKTGKSRNGPAGRALIRPKSHCELDATGQGRRFRGIAGVRSKKIRGAA
jgi:hypothetical protein